MDHTGRSRVGAVATAATAGFLVMVVAAGAGFEGIGVPGRFFSLEPGAVAAYVVPMLRFGYLVLLVVAFYRWLVTREGRSRRGAQRRPPSFLATFLALVLVAGGIFLFMATVDRTGVPSTSTSFPPNSGLDQSVPVADGVAPLVGEPGWGLVVLALAGLAGAILLVVQRYGRSDGAAVSARSAVPTVGSVGPSEGAAVPGGARSRVYAAYRRVEDAAQRSGMARAIYETVAAHLRRLHPPDPARLLTVAYHRARFSPLEVTEETAVSAEEAARALTEDMD
ncbi:MAG TPA: DUF4129 domain-containing protein [Acidimicrobiia bacterium]|nr:DUF4129 domain-containing protein [Acidimicrobiia bacterium]